jgi:hypothetical protein
MIGPRKFPLAKKRSKPKRHLLHCTNGTGIEGSVQSSTKLHQRVAVANAKLWTKNSLATTTYIQDIKTK